MSKADDRQFENEICAKNCTGTDCENCLAKLTWYKCLQKHRKEVKRMKKENKLLEEDIKRIEG